MRIGAWYVRSLYCSGSLTAVATELLRYTLDIAGIQEDSRDIGGTERARGLYFFYLLK
jgi:hypothetical protein